MAQGSSPVPSPTAELAEATLQATAERLCRAYTGWPRLVLDDPWAHSLEAEHAAVVAALSPLERSQLESAPMVERVLTTCPDVLAREHTAAAGLPRPVGRLAALPGLFAAEAPTDADEVRVVLEWTAIGLGCTGLLGESEARLAELQARLFAGMGLTLERYIELSLANADLAVSDRIFAAIHSCAERAGAHVIE